MFHSKSIKRLLSIFFLGLIFAVAASCGSGSSTGSTTTSANSGTVALLLTDAPSDIFEEINITVTRAELLSDDGQVTIFDGSLDGNRTFNLLDLTDAKIFAIREGIPAGTYSKIRLTLSEIQLVDYNDSDKPADYSYYYPKLPGNGKLDLNPRGSFDVVAGGTLTIQIDMDANKSIHIVKKGNKDEYNFRPVVFISIVTDAIFDRYVKLSGDVTDIDTTDDSFKLCNTDIPVQINDNNVNNTSTGCVRVETDSTTSIFDINGAPVTFSALVEGQPATVFGRLMRDSSSLSKDSGDDNDNDENNIDNNRELNDLVLKAKLIELGGHFLKLNGSATSAVDVSNLFTMDVASGQGFTTPYNISVQIQNGTLLINRNGVPVSSNAIINGKLLAARGVLDGVTDTLYASLIVIDTDSSTLLTGTVGLNPDNSCGFSLITAESVDRSIATDSDTKAFLVVGGSSTPITVGDLVSGQSADVYGNENNGCFDAEIIIAY
jgi:hypothetical protein